MTSSLRTTIEALPSTTAPIANSGWKRHADFAHEDQIERRVERRSHFRRDGNPAARQREDRRLPLRVSGKRNGKSPAGFGAVPKRHDVFLG
jgi:hypothetical protein